MVTIASLWLPILLAGVLVFIGSSVIHMLLGYHKNDFRPVPDEDAAIAAVRALNIPPGDYVFPWAGTTEAMNSDDFKRKAAEGPVMFFTILKPGAMLNMGPQMAQWFLYCVVVSVVAAYVASRTLTSGADYLAVFRLTGTVAFACYAMGHPIRSIWYKQNWATTARSMFDGLIYGCLTAGAFGWLWP